MAHIDKDPEREYRIEMEAIVDAYGPEEQALGWYCYLDDNITFPFTARCIDVRGTSPLQEGEKVTVTGIASEDDCMREMMVKIAWQGRDFAVPLAQLEPVKADDSTQEAVADWHYWVQRGYQLL